MENKAVLTVIIPCWNAGEYLRSMLDSILRQSFQDWRILVIDDGSEDNSREIVRSYHATDYRINLVERTRNPKGAQTCRNIGLELSTESDYVMILDADDLLAPYCFEQRVSYLSHHPDLDFAIFPAKSFKLDPSNETPDLVWGHHFFKDDLKAIIDGTLPMVGWTNIYRTSSLNNIFWDERILSLQDSDWNFCALQYGLKYQYAIEEGAKCDYYYRVSSSGSVAKKIINPQHVKNHFLLLEKWSLMLGDVRSQPYRRSLQSRFISYLRDSKGDGAIDVLPACLPHSSISFRVRFCLFKLAGFHGFRYLFHFENCYHNKMLREWDNKIHSTL